MNLSVVDVTELQASIALLFAACILCIIWLVILTHNQRKYMTVLESLVERTANLENLHIPHQADMDQDPGRGAGQGQSHRQRPVSGQGQRR